MASRVTLEAVLEQPTRRRVYEAIAARPGLRVGTVARVAGLRYDAAQHHVRVLVRLGLVLGDGAGQRRLFAAAARLDRAQRLAILAATPVAARVLELLGERGSVDLGTLRAALRLPKSSASGAVARLAAAGLVETRRCHRHLVVSVAPGARGSAPAGAAASARSGRTGGVGPADGPGQSGGGGSWKSAAPPSAEMVPALLW